MLRRLVRLCHRHASVTMGQDGAVAIPPLVNVVNLWASYGHKNRP